MTTKKGTQKLSPTGGGKAKWIGYIPYHLSEGDKLNIRTDVTSKLDVCERIGMWSEEGYTFSMRWDERSNCHVAYLTGYYVGCANAGLVLPARHTDVLTAVATLDYVTRVTFGDEAWTAHQGAGGDNDW